MKAVRTWMRISPAGRILAESKTAGFTLIELIVVLVIVGLLSGFVMPRVFGTLTHVELRSAARDTLTCLQQARDLAYFKKKYSKVSFDPGTGKVSLSSFQILNEWESMTTSAPQPEWGLIKEMAFSDNVKIDQCRRKDGVVVDGRFEVIFFPTGNCSGGQIQLINSKGRIFIIRVNPITGEPRIIDKKEAENG